MTTGNTTLLGLALPVQGELSGSWGDVINNYMTQYLDSAIAGTNVLSADVDVTLSKTSGSALTGASSQYAVLLCTGARTTVKTITAPAASKVYIVINATTGGFGVKVVGAGPTTGVTVAAGTIAQIAWNGSDFTVTSIVLNAANTWAATQTFNGTSSTFGTVLLDSAETVNIVAAAPAATTNLYVQSGAVQYYTSNAANNFIVNLAFSSGTAMNAALATGQVATAALITTQGSTAYYGTAVQVDGTAVGVTTRWISGAPIAGNASGLDTYRFAVIKTASATYTVLASLTQYKA